MTCHFHGVKSDTRSRDGQYLGGFALFGRCYPELEGALSGCRVLAFVFKEESKKTIQSLKKTNQKKKTFKAAAVHIRFI